MKRLFPALVGAYFLLPASLLAALSGTKAVGPTGDYASLTAALADVQAQTLDGPLVLELQPSYVSTAETFPLVFGPALTTMAANTLTIRPAAGATALSLSSADTTAATVDLNGAQFVTIDGRPGGVGSNAGSGGGTASQLTIANTSTSGRALRFINEASSNAIRYTTLRGVNTSTTSGTVLFSTTTGANGNDNNTIDHCDLREGASTPTNGLYSSGSTTTPEQANSGNIVSSCNLFNFYSSTLPSNGVRLDGGNTDWSITGNSFYQTASRTAVAATVRALYVNNTSGNNFTVTGNFIGGRAPNAGGTAWTTTGTTAAYLFQGIQLNVGTTTPSSVQGNTIANMVWTSNSTATTLPGVWSGIYVQAGSVNIGTVTGNTIGSGTGTGSVLMTTSGSPGTTFGIGSSSSGTVAIANNTIGSIRTANSTASGGAALTAIMVTAGTNTITGNTVGSATTPNSLNANNSAGAVLQQVTGIFSSSPTRSTISGNTVANLNNNSLGTAGGARLMGIHVTAGVNDISSNTVRNLTSTSANTTSTVSATSGFTVMGIAAISTDAGQTVSQNTVYALTSTHTTAAVNVTGIYFAEPTSGTNVIARNFVHSLAVSSSSATSVVNGMQFVAGTFTAQNNMVRVGLKADGTSTAGASIVRGIHDNGTTADRNFYHNSVYLSGVATSNAGGSFAFGGIATTTARTYQNNLFVNARSNSGGTGKHYAAIYGGTTVNPTGLTAGGNLFFATGTGGVLGLYNGVDLTSLAAWQTATGVDSASLNADPLFIAPTGTAATVDLHVQAASPASRTGLALAVVTDDFDGETRNATAPDIGADEFTATNAKLSGLTLGSATLNETFAPGTLVYTANVASSVSSLTVSPVKADTKATVVVTPASPVALAVGDTVISILVTAEDTVTTKTYTVTVTRPSSTSEWATQNGVSPDLTVVGANGQTNLVNYAFGMNPFGGSGKLTFSGTFASGFSVTGRGLPTAATETSPTSVDMRALYVRRKDAASAGLTYITEFSSNLTTWEPISSALTVLSDDGTYEVVSMKYPRLLSNGRKASFFRVRIILN